MGHVISSVSAVNGSSRAPGGDEVNLVCHPAFPAELGRYVQTQYYESRLGAGGTQVDHLLAFPRAAAGVVHRLLSQRSADDVAEGPASWRAIQRLFERWSTPATVLGDHVPTLWLELDDMDGPHARTAVPSVSLCLVPAYRWDGPLALQSHARDLQIIGEALAALQLTPPSSARARLSAAFSHGSVVRWIHLSVMLGREVPAIKLYGMARREQFSSWVASQLTAADSANLAEVLGELYPSELLGDTVFVDVNLNTLGERSSALGFAVGQQYVSWGRSSAGHAALLERWGNAGLCTAAEQAALGRWLSPVPGAAGPPAASRFLDLKLVCGHSGSLLAKAYRGIYGPPRALTAATASGAPRDRK